MYREKRIDYTKVVVVIVLLGIITGILYALDRLDGQRLQEAIQGIIDCFAVDGSYPVHCSLPGENIE